MATTTPNLNLTKPGLTDNADIATINANMDLLDAAIAAKATAHLATASDVNVTVTTAQTIATYTPVANGNFELRAYLRIITGATNVQVTVTYKDATGTQSKDISYPRSGFYFPCSGGQPFAVGSYPLAPLFIYATTGAPIVVNITASVANQALISCAIVGVSDGPILLFRRYQGPHDHREGRYWCRHTYYGGYYIVGFSETRRNHDPIQRSRRGGNHN